jgi:hypothetical protein
MSKGLAQEGFKWFLRRHKRLTPSMMRSSFALAAITTVLMMTDQSTKFLDQNHFAEVGL